MTPAATIDEKKLFGETFDELRGRLPASWPDWVRALKRDGIERFAAAGFPTTRDENWRTTSLAPLAGLAFRPAATGSDGVGAADLGRAGVVAPGAFRLVFVNGRYAPDLSSRGALPPGTQATSLAAALERSPGLIEPHLGRITGAGAHPFAALNAALFEDGAFVFVPDGVVLEDAIHLVFLTAGRGREGGPLSAHPRTLIVAGRQSRVTIVETYAGLGPEPCLGNPVTEIVLGDGAAIEHDRIQREPATSFHVSVCGARVGRDAVFTSCSVSLGGALVRNDSGVALAEPGGDCTLNGLFVASGRQHVDNHTTIDHARPGGSSRELFKGILDERARGVFDGRVVVRPDARKTDARQVNRNLLLSEECLIDTKPQLEILNDDVKCSHAATIGRLDQESLFYLRSRGIAEQPARLMLMEAFAGDVLSGIRVEPVRRAAVEAVGAWLARTGRGVERA
jgi:Fe-S cluster assembly protein SufD